MSVLRFALVFFSTLACSPFSAAEDFPFLAEINTDSVNIRAGQNTNYEILIQVDKAAQLVVVDKKLDWYKVKLPDSAKSYISTKYVKNLHSGIGEVLGSNVHIRAGTMPNSSSLGKLNKGDKIRILDKANDWYIIESVEGTYGWVTEKFVTFKSKNIPPPKIIVLPSPKIYPRAEKKVVQPPPPPDEKLMTVQGSLELSESPDAADGQYCVMTKDSTYTLEGGRDILDQFLHSQVKIEGVLDQATAASTSPVIKLRRVSFIL